MITYGTQKDILNGFYAHITSRNICIEISQLVTGRLPTYFMKRSEINQLMWNLN